MTTFLANMRIHYGENKINVTLLVTSVQFPDIMEHNMARNLD
jgi:hypothetical protein